jgi:hypothetical protein
MKPTKKQQTSPSIAKGNEQTVLEKLIRSATSYDNAWSLVRKTFPRAKYGKVRDVVQKFSAHKTLRAAFNAVHGKKSKPVKRGAKSEVQRAA